MLDSFDITTEARNYIADLAEDLEVPESAYAGARRSYHAVGEWLTRDQSTLKALNPRVYIQGSFRLGTAVKPIHADDHYDVDLICEMDAAKSSVTQQSLKKMFGKEIELYARAHSMLDPTESRRCWTLNYADGAQFHLDALPAIPDGQQVRFLLEERHLDARWAATAIAITDWDNLHFNQLTDRWPHSNPQGYTEWFRSRMKAIFDARRRAIALAERVSVEDIPSYQVKTPLQQAVQLLKRHRDIMFQGDPDDRPISVILTTLAGHAYSGEPDVADAMASILGKMDSFIVNRNGVLWIPNPTDPRENFADRWLEFPKRAETFFLWLYSARHHFDRLRAQTTQHGLLTEARNTYGAVAASAATRRNTLARNAPVVVQHAGNVLRATHRQVPPWPILSQGTVTISKASFSMNGYSTQPFVSDSAPLPKNAQLRFFAKTTVAPPFDVYWQVVNTGVEAQTSKGLRGGFDSNGLGNDGLMRKETTSYSGSHSIECFIVKNGRLAAKSGAFIVNIM